MTRLTSKRPSRSETDRARILRDVQNEVTATSRLNVQIPKDLLRDIKVIAAGREKTVSDIVRELLIEYRNKYSNE